MELGFQNQMRKTERVYGVRLSPLFMEVPKCKRHAFPVSKNGRPSVN